MHGACVVKLFFFLRCLHCFSPFYAKWILAAQGFIFQNNLPTKLRATSTPNLVRAVEALKSYFEMSIDTYIFCTNINKFHPESISKLQNFILSMLGHINNTCRYDNSTEHDCSYTVYETQIHFQAK